MRLALLLALAAACGAGPSVAQTAPLRRPLATEGMLRGPVAARADAEIEAARMRSEARLREREDKARRTLKGICSGC